MSDWECFSWGDLVELKYGKSLKGYQEKTNGYRVYGTNGPIGYNEEYLFDQPSIIIGRKGAYRGVEYSSDPFYVIDTAYYTVNKVDFLDQKFGYYQLLTKNINSLDSGSAIPSTSRDDFYSLEAYLPPLSEQIEIRTILDTINQKINLLRQQNETLEQIAQTLFKRWFVDFEFPNQNGRPYKSSGGQMVPSELGEIPEGWNEVELKKICRVINGRAYKNDEFLTEGTPIIRIQNLNGGTNYVYSDLTLEDDKYVSRDDLIFAWSATFGPFIWRGPRSIYHYHIWKLDCFQECDKIFLYEYLKRITSNVSNQGTGSIFSHITKSLMESQTIVYPSEDVREQFHELAERLNFKISTNHSEIETLTQLRDTLLPKLMSGEIRVKME